MINHHLNFSCPPGNVCFKQDNFVLSVVLFLLAGIIYAYVQSNQQQQTPPPPPPPPSYTPTQVVEQQPQRDMSHRRLGDPVEEPRRTYPFTTTVYNNVQRYQQQKQPINISTRGETRDFQPIGTLTNTTNNNNNNNTTTSPHILQLFGRAIYPGSYKWQYYTNSDNFQSVKVQLVHKGRQCLDDIGCEELSTGDIVRVPAYQNLLFRVELYGLDKPTYIPYIL